MTQQRRGPSRPWETMMVVGEQKGQQDLLLRLLARKFGTLSAEQRRRIVQADGETLLRWSEQVLFAATAEEALR